LEYAESFARWYGAKITVLHTYAEQSVMVIAVTMPPPIDKGALQQHLDEFTKSMGQTGVAAETLLREGNPVSQILDVADSLPADMIIMGTHGRGGFDRVTLGSVTEKVLRKTSCPILTVTLRMDPDARADTKSIFKRILCAVDFSDASSAALRYAISIAQEARGKLSLVHIIEGPPDPERDMDADRVPEYLQEMERKARARLQALVPAETRQVCQVQELVQFGKPYSKILHVEKEQRADLLVIGAHSASLINTLLFGSTTDHVVRQAGCPVLTVRR
jgi:nucleotide-binding universal stress UspA family protein